MNKSARLLCTPAFLLLASSAAFAATPAVLPPAQPYVLAQQAAIVLERSNTSPREAMPLGNGSLGAAVWSQDGMTIQLNRADTLPGRKSPGQLVLPGLAKLTAAPDYTGRLDLSTGEFVEQGGGVRATAYIESASDALVVEVAGADPATEQTAELHLWQPRAPRVLVTDNMGVLAETWQDVGDAGASGETFGSLAAIRVDASGAKTEATGGEGVRVRFHPKADGTYRIFVSAPAWRGGDAPGYAAESLMKAQLEPAQVHRDYWHHFWMVATPIAMHSQNGEAEYLAQLRDIYLYTAAAEVGTNFPGSHAGIGDLFSTAKDDRFWDPSAYWHWNLRMLTAANLGASLPSLNRSYFALYRENLPAIAAWTKQHMGNRPGVCVPETMRFNGKGYENETWAKQAAVNCGEDFMPFYNARTISTGAEIALWIWRQYLETDDRAFLAANYPVMEQQARFLLAYSSRDKAGILHTQPANAHENQWDVLDPVTDILAMKVVFADTAHAAAILGRDPDLAARLRDAVQHLPALPQVTIANRKLLASADNAADILADSYEPGASLHNVENLGLEPVWPYELIGPRLDDPMHALGVRTFEARLNRQEADWSYDPVQAAHLGLAADVRSTLLSLTEKYQAFPSGMAEFISHDFFVEQIGVLTLALQDALVQQDADGVLLIAPAWPTGWDVDGTVAVAHNMQVRVLVLRGQIQTVAITSRSGTSVTLHNPWPGQEVSGMRAGTAVPVQKGSGDLLCVPARSGPVVLESGSMRAIPAAVAGHDPTPKRLGQRTIGLFAGPA
jgi:alpha-L-fucosidase 2